MLIHKKGKIKLINPNKLYFDQKKGVVIVTKISRTVKKIIIQYFLKKDLNWIIVSIPLLKLSTICFEKIVFFSRFTLIYFNYFIA